MRNVFTPRQKILDFNPCPNSSNDVNIQEQISFKFKDLS